MTRSKGALMATRSLSPFIANSKQTPKPYSAPHSSWKWTAPTQPQEPGDGTIRALRARHRDRSDGMAEAGPEVLAEGHENPLPVRGWPRERPEAAPSEAVGEDLKPSKKLGRLPNSLKARHRASPRPLPWTTQPMNGSEHG